MNSERAQEIDEIFQAALDLPSEQRAAYLDQACASDHDLRVEVESLISSFDQADSFMEQPAIEVDASVLAGPLMSAMAGESIGHYQIVEPLGSGGMGEVYLGSDTRMDRKVALKLLPQYFTEDQERVRRFQQEAHAALKLNHPNIVTIYEIGEANGRHFIATEFIQGETLRQRMARDSLPLSEALDIACQVADALTSAHGAGIVHRDIKPENIMLRRDGFAKVLDFGLAKLTEGQGAAADAKAPAPMNVKTDPGMVMGTANYMSPEQARGVKVDARTDIWSLGVVIYEMVSGRMPFEGETPSDVVSLILQREAPHLVRYVPEVPSELQRIVDKSLTKNRDERYQTAKDLSIDLRQLRKRLDFEDELQRSTPPELASHMGTATLARLASRTAEGAAHRTSSAEYLIGKIKRHHRGAILTLAGIAAALAIATYFYYARAEKTAIESIAILPFTNANGDQNTEYLSDGITESLIDSLSQLPNLRVMSRNSVFRYKGKSTDAQAAGKELGVQAILTGTLMQRGDGLLISTELVSVSDNSHIWGAQYNGKLTDLLAVQEDISRQISRKLRLRLTGDEQKRVTRNRTDNLEAYQLYLKGRYYWSKRTDEGFTTAIDYFQRAIDLDPNYVLAYTGLADCYTSTVLWGLFPPKESFPRAKAAARKALELDDTLAESHTSLASIMLYYDWDFPGAEREFKRAIELNPNNASAHYSYGLYLEDTERFDQALVEMKRAQDLDPLSPHINANLGWPLYYMRQYDRAIEEFRKALDRDPSSALPHHWLAMVYRQKGMYGQSIIEYQRALQLAGSRQRIMAELGYVYGISGKKDEAQKQLLELRDLSKEHYVSSYYVALVYIGLGEKDHAFELLDLAYEERSPRLVDYFRGDPTFDSLHSDPRFASLVRRIGPPQ